MAGKSLYDILEVSPQASPDVIRAAYERLTAALDLSGDVRTLDSDTRIRLEAIKQAFLTLSAPEKRARYDSGLAKKQFAAPQSAPPAAPYLECVRVSRNHAAFRRSGWLLLP